MKSLSFSKIALLMVVVVSIWATSCKEEVSVTPDAQLVASYDANLALSWYTLFLEIDRYSPGYRPPAAARLLAYTGLAAYESGVPGMPEYNSLRYQFQGLDLPVADLTKEYHWPASINASYATMFRHFYPHVSDQHKAKITALENQFNKEYKQSASEEVFSRSAAFGEAVAEAVYEFSATDTPGHEAYLNPRPASYIPPAVGPNGEKLWQPTFPDYTAALFPYWGSVRTFGMRRTDLLAQPPIPYSEDASSLFYQQANEVRTIVNLNNFTTQWVAEFWSDDIFELTFEPAARQIAIANILVEQEDISLDVALELYAKMGMALCDVGVAVWNSKYIYNVIRPIEYVRTVMEPGWNTALNNPLNNVKSLTPEFPAYPSGHSGFGGAGSSVMAEIFGNNTTYTDVCHYGRTEFASTPRTYTTIMDAGVENAYSRLPLGVHFRMDCDEGLRLGYLASKRISELPWRN